MKFSARLIVIAAAVLAASCTSIRSVAPPTCTHHHEAIEKDIGYCQAVRSGSTLHVSGVVGQGPMPDAIKSAYSVLGKVLAENGLTPSSVVKENVYATDLDAFIQNKALRKEFYGDHLPAATWVQVQRLYLPSFVVEIELTAEYSR